MPGHAESVERNYGQPDLRARLLAVLEGAGKDLNNLTVEDLTPIGEFHIRGQEATLELARLAGLREEMRILDIGCGIGGPARTLVSEFGCHVTGLDLTEEFCRVADMLNERVGIGDKITVRHRDALEMPFDDGSFDLVWTQHTSMNIEDKERLFRDIHRVLRPGGRLAFHDILAGPVQPIHFPVPWARDPSISFLARPDDLHPLLKTLDFREVAWVDQTQSSIAWFQAFLARAAESGPPPLSPALIVGPDFPQMGRNVLRNMEEERVMVVQAVLERTP